MHSRLLVVALLTACAPPAPPAPPPAPVHGAGICPAVSGLAAPDAPARATTGDVAGQVYSIRGMPLQGAQVTVGQPGEKHVRGAITTEDGSFRIARVEPGEHQLVFTLIGHGRQTHQVHVAAGRTQRVCAVLSHVPVHLMH